MNTVLFKIALNVWTVEGLMLLLSAAMMSWARVWVDLDLFTTQFSDKVLLDTWKLIECE